MNSISATIIRGGSSKGVFFKKEDLPTDELERQKIILDVMEGSGHGDLRQIDGLGGANSLTAKVAVVSKSKSADVDLDYHFYQVIIGKGEISDHQNCGNILAGVLPFALQENMCAANHHQTTKIVKMLNSDSLCEVTVQTPNGIYNPVGTTKVHGVKGTGSEILCNYLDIAGKNTGSLTPTGRVKNQVNGVEITCVDNGMPVVLLRAQDLGINGNESKKELDQNSHLKRQLEEIRLKVGKMMNLGDVTNKTVPKMVLISSSKSDCLINTRTFIPHVCHAAIGVLGAVATVTGCLLPGSVAEELIRPQKLKNGAHQFSVEHPSGSMDVTLDIVNNKEQILFPKSGVVRTARILLKGEVYLP